MKLQEKQTAAISTTPLHRLQNHPQGASVDDVYLTEQQFLAAAEAWDRTTQDTPKGLKPLLKIWGSVHLHLFARQSTVLGFGRIDDFGSIDRLDD